VSVETAGVTAHRDATSGSGVMISSWLSNSVSFLASPDWIKKLASNRRVARIVTNKAEQLPRPFRVATR
jgi:hypothetical protein